MQFIKQKIQNNFSRASTSYESVAWVQKESSKILVSKLRQKFPSFYPKTILDLGTGTGFLPKELLCFYDQSFYTLNDISSKMIDIVCQKFKNNSLFSFSLGDFETENFSKHDLIISNLSFQWAADLKKTISKFFNYSKIFAFSSLLEGSFIEWNNFLATYGVFEAVQKYPSKEVFYGIIESLSPSKFCFYNRSFEVYFSSAKEFISYLRALGACSIKKNVSPVVIKKMIQNSHINLKITYDVLFCFIKR